MPLDKGTTTLIAVGAAVAANCQPCLDHCVKQAVACGVAAEEVADAIKVGKKVRNGAAAKMDDFVLSPGFAMAASPSAAAGDCCSTATEWCCAGAAPDNRT